MPTHHGAAEVMIRHGTGHGKGEGGGRRRSIREGRAASGSYASATMNPGRWRGPP
jgi:hypothetical protein